MDDAALLRRIWTGNEAAFTELFARYQRRIFQYATRMCGHAAGDDVVQETFLAVLKPGCFDASKGGFAGYLFGIARHQIARHLAKQGTPLIEAETPSVMTVATDEESAFDALAREQDVAALRAALDGLPPAFREVVVLCDLQEMDYATVASVMQCPIGTVRSRLHRARALLATKLTRPDSTNEGLKKYG